MGQRWLRRCLPTAGCNLLVLHATFADMAFLARLGWVTCPCSVVDQII